MDQCDLQLPSWTAALNSPEQVWNDDTNIMRSTQQQIASVAAMTAPNLTGSSLEHDTTCQWPKSSDTTYSRIAAATTYDRMWDPIPTAPQDFRTEVLDLFSMTTPTEHEPALQDISQSAPTGSDFTSTAEPDSSKLTDAPALSRTRSQPNTAEQKQANARESQKRFRMRQKVQISLSDGFKHCTTILTQILRGTSLWLYRNIVFTNRKCSFALQLFLVSCRNYVAVCTYRQDRKQ